MWWLVAIVAFVYICFAIITATFIYRKFFNGEELIGLTVFFGIVFPISWVVLIFVGVWKLADNIIDSNKE